MRLADAWSLITPKHLAATSQLAAASTPQTNNKQTLSDRERSLLAECVRLRQQLDRLQPTHVQSDRLVHINAVDAQVLWASRKGREAFIGLTDPTSTDRDAFVVADSAVDIGSAIGIEADGLVLAGRRLIGRVETVGLRSCGVVPTTSADFQIPVEIVRRANSTTFVGASGTYRGDGASAGVVDFIPADAAVSVGDEVFTQADSLWSGERLHVGTISAADLPAGEPHWRIVVTPSGIVAPRDHVLVLRPRVRADLANDTLLSTGRTRDSQRAK